MKIKVTKLPKSEVEIEGELSSDSFEGYFGRALKKLGETLELPGFRKGKAPENVLLGKIPEIRILEEMANMALSEHYPRILAGEYDSEKIDAIGEPEVSIMKLARKNPLAFKVKAAIVPEVKLPDYKKISKKITGEIAEMEKTPSVTEKELEDTILDIRKSRAPKTPITSPQPSPQGGEGESPFPSQGKAGEEVELPELNDEFVKSLGPFTDVADFKSKLKDNIKLEKENQAKEKTRLKIIEEIIKESEMELPELLVRLELEKILYRMESDIARMGLKFEDYLKHLNKTKDDLRKDFRTDAEKKAKLALVLNEIAKTEQISAPEKELGQEIERILEHYKEADPERVRMHAEQVLVNEKIFRLLESQ